MMFKLKFPEYNCEVASVQTSKRSSIKLSHNAGAYLVYQY
ncbi:hypothetical protein NSE_0951 [Neorickettsia sennetsu str. Miyayama]|uniref:Uncharacterized protein n=1 Tax=Ehrlichia sennetsu (strain ATCC VR-367 / Miyayama) TaxID=222891 RepID=Q2GCI1_EHRS3|nr:hypothetical protein NSE_0951 [Neorickettsia sennetsu str. Miyayama]